MAAIVLATIDGFSNSEDKMDRGDIGGEFDQMERD